MPFEYCSDLIIAAMNQPQGGYNIDDSTGEFLLDNPMIQVDLKNPSEPKTFYGLLYAARRFGNGEKQESSCRICSPVTMSR